MDTDPNWYVGVDWATEWHQVCLMDEQGKVLGERSFAHSGVGLNEMACWLLELTAGDAARVAVSIEVPHGAVVETLLERGFAVYAINPKQLDRFRDRFTVAGAKDDRRDALVLADSLRTDRPCFRRLEVDAAAVIELREWSRMAEDLQQERVRASNRMREQLRRYYPQAIELADDVAAEWFLDLWTLMPTPAKAARVRATSVTGVLKQHRIRRLDAAAVLEVLRQPAVTVAPGTVEAACAHIRSLVERIRLVNRQLKDCHKRLDAICAQLATEKGEGPEGQKCEQRDVEILRSLPGVGRIVLATLLAEASQPLRNRDYHALRSLSGVAPVTKRSGKRCVVGMRKACHLRLRGALYHWARVAVQHDPLSRTRYAALRSRGHSHGRALRGVADRLLAVACAMLRDQTLFEPRPVADLEAAA
jgi:transposase